MPAEITIIDYRNDWAKAFQALATRIRTVAPPGSRLHHIGSTAVPGLAAKDVIDLQLSVGDLDEVEAGALAAIGFAERPGLSDHVPPTLALPAEDLVKRFFRHTGRPANLHVRVHGRFNQRYPLLCRDYLRAHPVAAASYAAIKQTLAGWFPADEDAYYAVKDPLFDIIMTGAESWARLTGWRAPQED